jgi:hypothetical protein
MGFPMAIARTMRSWSLLVIVVAVVSAPAVTAAAPGDPRPDFGSGGVARFTFAFPGVEVEG